LAEHTPTNKTVISASRRTDIPAFYMPWFMERLQEGRFEIVNPFNNRVKTVSAGPDQVHSIVFWSKNFGPFIQGDYGTRLEEMGYHLFFNFTINSAMPILEPAVPGLDKRIEQLNALAGRFNPGAINWRFDPLSFFRTGEGMPADNLGDFSRLAAAAYGAGIRRCVTSFMDVYPKIKRRVKKIKGFVFVDPPIEKKIDILYQMQETLMPLGIELQMCCERALLERLPDDLPVRSSACVPSKLLAALYGTGLSMRRDTGQRVKAGCGCGVSVDIGSYRDHPCKHGCLYCYASPVGNETLDARNPESSMA
jgi:hypothetical protein